MASIKGTKTEQNLLKAFAGESQARNRYTYFASSAKKEGFVLISMIFEETAAQEQVHAKQFFKFLEGGPLEITAVYPAGMIGSTLENLNAAAEGENEEWTMLYPAFAQTAKEEGFPEVAAAFTAISIAEKRHEERYNNLIKKLEEDTMFKRDNPVIWRCLNCGYLHEAAAAPKQCAACKHPQSYFEVFGEVN
ncbi:MAG: rubrerythrin family protein [Spirochaetes bacterium]|nr:rubrerythrin family protein [Spirochaetota bacterium]